MASEANKPMDEEFVAVQATIKSVARSIASIFITLIVSIAGCCVARDEMEYRHQREMAQAGFEQVAESVQSGTGLVIRESWKATTQETSDER